MLPELLAQEPVDIHAVAKYFDEILKVAVAEVNSNFGPLRLVKRLREEEPLTTDKRQLSSYRTRIGTMLEYAISTAMNRLLRESYGPKYLLTFVSAHQYPDFYLRDNTLTTLLRIEMKAVDAESDEQAARFDVPTNVIDTCRDMILFIAWSWEQLTNTDGKAVGEYPHIFASLMVPAKDIVEERDLRLKLTGGKLEKGIVYVFSDKQKAFVHDPGNYGKLWRLVHRSRRNLPELSEGVRSLLEFLQKVDEKSPRTRFRGP